MASSNLSSGVVGSESWECDKCTFINDPSELTCLMCYTVRVSTKELAVNWQWQANAEQWIPYDLPTTMQIEEAFQKGTATVTLSKGYFSTVPNYTITFQRVRKMKKHKAKDAEEDDKTVLRIVQTNTATGNVRNVRRLGDGSEQFEEVKWDLISEEEKCSICQMEFLEPPMDEALDPVPVLKSKAEATDETEELATETEAAPPSRPKSGSKKRPSKELSKSDVKTRSHSKLSKSASAGATGPTKSGGAEKLPKASSTGSVNAAKSKKSSPKATAAGAQDEKQMESEESQNAGKKSRTFPDENPVKLPKCSGHYFHRPCLIQWLKLRDHCPYCKTKL